jgi:hypothetical protein
MSVDIDSSKWVVFQLYTTREIVEEQCITWMGNLDCHKQKKSVCKCHSNHGSILYIILYGSFSWQNLLVDMHGTT